MLYYYAGLTLGGELTLGKNVKRLKVGVYGEWSNGEDAASISTFKVQEGSVLEEISITKQYDYGSDYHLFTENASVSLPATIKVIGDGVFSNFKGTINADFSNLVSIGKRAFYAASCSIPNGFSSALSKIARVVDIFSHRLQVQERMTQQIKDCIQDTLHPLGVMVVVEAKHMCMQMRGIEKQNSITTTSDFSGAFNQAKTRQEFMNLIHNNQI